MNFDLDLQHYCYTEYTETNNNTNRGSRRTQTINKGGRRCRCVGAISSVEVAGASSAWRRSVRDGAGSVRVAVGKRRR
jgi:RPA family protein